MSALLLNKVRGESLLAKENHAPRPKGVQGKAGGENIFRRAKLQRFCHKKGGKIMEEVSTQEDELWGYPLAPEEVE